jgi:hypothetical protein
MTDAAQRRVGAYAKLLANYASDDAIIEAGEAAELLFCRGLAFCATSDADGFITDSQVVRYVGAGMRDAPKRARRLAEVGVWERLDGGYLVRSWTKIHPTSEEKGRRRKADRERKRTKAEDEAESDDTSDRIPDGIQKEAAPESLSLIQSSAVTQQRNDTTEQIPSSLGEHRYETLDPATARCTDHRGIEEPPNCRGCMKARENAQAALERRRLKKQRRTDNCPDCFGEHWLLDHDGKPTAKCDHRRTA